MTNKYQSCGTPKKLSLRTNFVKIRIFLSICDCIYIYIFKYILLQVKFIATRTTDEREYTSSYKYMLYIYIYDAYFIYLDKKLIAFNGLTVSNQNKKSDVTTSTTSLFDGCGCCDNLCWRCLLVDLLFPEIFGNGKKLRRVFMERFQECEGVILAPPLQFNEGFFYLTHTAFMLVNRHVLM